MCKVIVTQQLFTQQQWSYGYGVGVKEALRYGYRLTRLNVILTVARVYLYAMFGGEVT